MDYYPLPADKIEPPKPKSQEDSQSVKFGKAAIKHMIVGDVIPNFGTVTAKTDDTISFKDHRNKTKKYKLNGPDATKMATVVGGLISMSSLLSKGQLGNCLDAIQRDSNFEIVDGVAKLNVDKTES